MMAKSIAMAKTVGYVDRHGLLDTVWLLHRPLRRLNGGIMPVRVSPRVIRMNCRRRRNSGCRICGLR